MRTWVLGCAPPLVKRPPKARLRPAGELSRSLFLRHPAVAHVRHTSPLHRLPPPRPRPQVTHTFSCSAVGLAGHTPRVAHVLVIPGVVHGSPGCVSQAGRTACLRCLWMSPSPPHPVWNPFAGPLPQENTESGMRGKMVDRADSFSSYSLPGKLNKKGREIFSVNKKDSIDWGAAAAKSLQ